MIFKPGNGRIEVFKGIYKKLSTRTPNFLCSFEKRNNLTVYTVNIKNLTRTKLAKKQAHGPMFFSVVLNLVFFSACF